jgi:hypothetical protein
VQRRLGVAAGRGFDEARHDDAVQRRVGHQRGPAARRLLGKLLRERASGCERPGAMRRSCGARSVRACGRPHGAPC